MDTPHIRNFFPIHSFIRETPPYFNISCSSIITLSYLIIGTLLGDPEPIVISKGADWSAGHLNM